MGSRIDDIDSLLEEIDEIKERIDFFSQSLSNIDERDSVYHQLTKIERENQIAFNSKNCIDSTNDDNVFVNRKSEPTENDPYAE